MKKLLVTPLLIFLFLFSQAREISESSYFSLLTCQPGNEIHAHFGHTAIRFADTVSGVDFIFNYGMFSYSDDFLYKFVKGETYYQLGIQRYADFVEEYQYDKRAVVEQKLALTQSEKEELYSFLRTNYLPENRKYLYNFLYDNCSSRPRDIFSKLLGKKLTWKEQKNKLRLSDSLWLTPTFKYLHNDFKTRTWRDFLNLYVGPNQWLQMGIGLVLGVDVDKHLTRYQAMFLPDCLLISLENATVTRNGKEIPLVSKTAFLVTPTVNLEKPSFFSKPATILWIACVLFLCLALFEYKTKRHFYWIDSLLYFIIGVLGVIIWYVSFESIHPAAFPNLNVIWMSPFHILFAILWLIPKLRKYTKIYLNIYSIIFILYIITAPFNPQFIHAGFIAILLIMVSRVKLEIKKKKLKKHKY